MNTIIRNYSFYSCFMLLAICNTPALSQEVISTSGNYQNNSSGSISYSIGEPVIETYKTTDIILTQGFQQSNLIITAIEEYTGLGFDILSYPNPAKEYVILWVSKEDKSGLYFLLYDASGKLLVEEQILDSETIIPFDRFVPGDYILKVTMGNKELKSFKIVKTQ